MKYRLRKLIAFILVLVMVNSFFSVFADDLNDDGIDDVQNNTIENNDITTEEVDDAVSPSSVTPTPNLKPEIKTTQTLFSDVEYNMVEEITLLNALGIIKGYEDNTFKPNNQVTRAEYIAVIARLLQLEYNNENISNFEDVSKSDWSWSSINAGVYAGLIEGFSETEFKPNEAITLEQAVKIIMKSIGYDVYAKSKGGYPTGYLTVAAEKGVLDGVKASQGSPLTREMVAKLIYNALKTDIMEIVSIGSNTKYAISEGKNILNTKLKVNKSRGVVNGNYETLLYNSNSSLSKEEVLINDKKFNLGNTNAKELLGYNVEYYYKDYEDGRGNTLVCISLNKNVEKNIKHDNFANVSNLQITFWEEQKNDNGTKKMDLSSSVDIIYNGKNAVFNSTYNLTYYLVTQGFDKIKAIDYNSDGKYDVLFIEKYKTFSIKNTNSELHSLKFNYAVNGNESYNELDVDDNSKIITIIKDDNLATFSDIKKGDIVSVAESITDTNVSAGKRRYDVIVYSKSLTGKIDEISYDDGAAKYSIDGNIYQATPAFLAYLTSINKPLLIGDEGKFFLNFEGKIADIDIKSSTGKKYGVLFNAKIGSGLDSKVQVELLTEANKFEIFDVSKKMDLTYYPRYTPWAKYKDDSGNILPHYLDPILARKGYTAEQVYPSAPQNQSAIDMMLLFRQEYKETNKEASELFKKYFLIANSEGNYEFDLEKIQLVRYSTDENGKLKSIETAKDYGLPLQWAGQNGRTISNETALDREKDTFRLSVKAPIWRDPINGNRPIYNQTYNTDGSLKSGTDSWLAYRYYVAGRVFYENIKEWLPRTGENAIENTYNGYTDTYNPNTTVTDATSRSDNDYQPALFFVGLTSTMFTMPRPDQIISNMSGVSSLDSQIAANRKSDIYNLKRDKNNYYVGKFPYIATSNVAIEAYNTDDFNTANLFVRYLNTNYLSGSYNVLVDKVVSVINKNGVQVQKLYGYYNGVLKEYVGDNNYVFNRKLSGAPFKTGDYVAITKATKELSYISSIQKFEYNENEAIKFYKNYSVTSPYFNFLEKTAQETINTITNNAYKSYFYTNKDANGRSDFVGENDYKGSQVTNGIGSYGHIYGSVSGMFAGKILDKNNDFIKMIFDENIRFSGDKPRYDRIDKKFMMNVNANVIVYIVENNKITIGTYDDIEPGDFILARYTYSNVIEIVKYNNLSMGLRDR